MPSTQPSMTGGGDGAAGGGGGRSQLSGHSHSAVSTHEPSGWIMWLFGRHCANCLPALRKHENARVSWQQWLSIHEA